MTSTWLIAGLGNPGPDYASTRHNIGFLATDALAARIGARLSRHKRAHALVAEGRVGSPGADHRVVIVQPQDYMNLSGGAVGALLDYYDVAIEHLMVVHDDLDLEFDQLRVKFGGGDGGHNGLRSIRSAIGTGEYVRIRLGIGRPPGRQDPADYVLKPFNAEQRAALPAFIDRADDAMMAVIEHGVAWAQNAYNGKEVAE